MSHQIQLSPAASHCPTAVLDPAGQAAEPTACRSRWAVLPRPDMRRILSHLWKSDLHGHRSHPRQRLPGEPGTGTAGPVRAVLPRSSGKPDSPEEGAAGGHRGQLAPHYVPGHPGSDLPARLMTAIDLRGTPELPAIDSRRPTPPDVSGSKTCGPAPDQFPDGQARPRRDQTAGSWALTVSGPPAAIRGSPRQDHDATARPRHRSPGPRSRRRTRPALLR